MRILKPARRDDPRIKTMHRACGNPDQTPEWLERSDQTCDCAPQLFPFEPSKRGQQAWATVRHRFSQRQQFIEPGLVLLLDRSHGRREERTRRWFLES
jgi:hypothetical protein